MKFVKLLGGLVGISLIVVVGVLAYVIINLNTLVKEGVETHGPEITRTTVLLDKVDISIFDGKGELNDFSVGNPKGFQSEHLLKWDTIRLQVKPASLRSDVVVVEDFTVEGVVINAEQKGFSTNLKAFLDGMKKGDSTSSSDKDKSPAEEDGAEVRIAMKHIKFNNNAINFISEKHGTFTLEMPAFELDSLGDPNVGLTPTELGIAILKPLVDRAKDHVEKRAKDLIGAELKEKLEAKKEELKEKVEVKKEELKAKAEDKKEALKEKVDVKKEELDVKKDELKAKTEEKKDQLKDKVDSKLKDFLK